MAGGTKPGQQTRRAERYKDGAKTGGGVNARKHAGPKRPSKTVAKGARGSQQQRRVRGG